MHYISSNNLVSGSQSVSAIKKRNNVPNSALKGKVDSIMTQSILKTQRDRVHTDHDESLIQNSMSAEEDIQRSAIIN